MQAHRDGSYSQAQQLLDSAVQTRPRDPVLRENLADAYVAQGNFNKAITELSRAVEMSGGDSRLSVKLGRLYLQSGSWLAASEYANRALKANRKSAEAWALLAETKLAKGQLTDSLADFQRSLRHESSNPNVQFKIAQIQQLLGRPLRAFSAVEQLLQDFPVDQQPENALLLAGNLLIKLQQPAQAIEKLQIATHRSDATEAAFIALSSAQIAIGQPSQARLTLANAQLRYPRSTDIAGRLADLQDDAQRIASLEHSEIVPR